MCSCSTKAEEEVAGTEVVAEAEVVEAEVTGKCNGITTWPLSLTLFFHCRGRTKDILYTVLFY